MLLGLPLLAAVALASQSPDPRPPGNPADRPPPPKGATATRAARPHDIDGRDDDEVWREAVPITEIQEWRPSEVGPPKLPTEARTAYDAATFNVCAGGFEPHADSIITVLARRD